MSNDSEELNTLAFNAFDVVINGLTSLLAMSNQKVVKQVVGRDIVENQQREPATLPPSMYQTIGDIAEDAGWLDASKSIEIISLFLQTAEVEEIVRQVY